MNKQPKATFSTQDFVQVYKLYYDTYSAIPSSYDYPESLMDKDLLVSKLKKSRFQINDAITRYYYEDGQEHLFFYYADFKGQIAVFFERGGSYDPIHAVSIFYNPKSDVKVLQRLKSIIRSCLKVEDKA
ncbi:MAG: hypothetical protein ACKOXB_15780 [Flavobacteriales bacterium]